MAPLQIGTVVSDEETPTFEIVRIKLKLGCDVKPGTLVQIPVKRNGEAIILVARTRSAHEYNPNERPEDINVRETLGLSANYPTEADSTVIYRMIEADLIEEIRDGELSAPQTLPASGAPAYLATESEIVRALGLLGADDGPSLHIGRTISGTPVEIRLRREAIQRHMFICGTTGSGKSYAVGVIAEELISHGLPVVFLDTQDEYSTFVSSNGGIVVTPGKDFTIRISSLSESDLLDLLPSATTELQRDIIVRAFSELQGERFAGDLAKFEVDDLIARIRDVGPSLTNQGGPVSMAASRAGILNRDKIFGGGIDTADWRRLLHPCMAINCKGLRVRELQTVATAMLRELQTLRMLGHIPPYAMVIDEAHLFVPESEGSA